MTWLLNYSGRLAVRRFASKLQPYGITPPQWGVLICLAEKEGQSLTELGNKGLCDGPTMTGIVDRLESGGLVERRRDNSDRRVISLYLTEQGRTLLGDLPAIGQQSDRELLGGTLPTDVDCFLQALQKVIRNLS